MPHGLASYQRQGRCANLGTTSLNANRNDREAQRADTCSAYTKVLDACDYVLASKPHAGRETNAAAV